MVYYFFIAFWTAVSQLASKSKSIFRTKGFSFALLFLMFFAMAAVAILRPKTGDMRRYLQGLDMSSSLTWLESVRDMGSEVGFVSYQWLLSKITTSEIVFIGLSLLIMWILLIFALKQVISTNDLPILLFGYISFFYFYNFSTNTVRQGFAAPLILIMIFYLGKSNYRKSIIYLLIAVSFHMTAIISSVLLVIRRFDFSIRSLCIIYVISILLMVTGFNQELMSNLAFILGGEFENKVIGYSSEAVLSSYGKVNRIDFLIFTSFWIVWGLWFRKYYLKGDMFYEWLIKSYLVLGSIYVLFGFIGYSDRIAAYAWFLIPLLLFYPALKINTKYRKLWLVTFMLISIFLFFYFGVYSLYTPLKLMY
jgi:hypothetical protein